MSPRWLSFALGLLLVLAWLPAQGEDAGAAAHAEVQELGRRIKVARETGDHEGEIAAWEDYVRLLERQPGPETRSLANALNKLAGALRQQGRYDRALPVLERALAISERVVGSDHPETLTLINNAALILENLGRFEPALEMHRRALARREVRNGPVSIEVATSLNNLGVLHRSLGRYSDAVALFERALAITEQVKGPEDMMTAICLGNLASALEAMGDYARALPLTERSLVLTERIKGPDDPEMARALNNLAGMFYTMGLNDRAIPYLERALKIVEKNHGAEHPKRALAANNLAEVLKAAGRYDEALPLYRLALAVSEKAMGPSHGDTAACLNNLAGLLLLLGRRDDAEPLLMRALEIRRTSLGAGHPETAQAINNLAFLYSSMKQYERALLLQQQALDLVRAARGDGHADTARALGNLAGLLTLLGRFDEAAPLHEEAVAIAERALGPDHPRVSGVLSGLAENWRRRGDPARALPLYLKAYRVAGISGEPELVRQSESALRNTYQALGQPELAIFFGKCAVNTIQAMRARARGMAGELQESLVQSRAMHYRELAALLIENGRLEEAQQVLAMLKENELFEFIRRDNTADPRVTRIYWSGAEGRFAMARERIDREVADLVAERRALDMRAKIALSDTETARRNELLARLAVLNAQAVDWVRELNDTLPAEQKGLVEEARRRQEVLAAATRAELARIGEGAALVQYLLLGDRVRILVTAPDELLAREARIDDADLYTLLLGFSQSARTPGEEYRPAAKRLHDLLVGPIAGDLDRLGVRTLILSLDGALRYVPFAALFDGQRHLVERFNMTLLTAASGASLSEPAKKRWKLAGFGVSRPVEGFVTLPAVEAELKGIVGGQGLVGETILNRQFTASALKRALTRDFSAVHLASHFAFRPGNETASFLLLGDGSRLTLRELREGDYRFDSLDLLTLSACETAIAGGREADGREVEGFGVLAQKKGAKGVLATLWPIADESTARLMQDFYRLREKEGLPKAEALRRAQIALMNRAEGSRRPYAHPFFWAPFLLMGNGR